MHVFTLKHFINDEDNVFEHDMGVFKTLNGAKSEAELYIGYELHWQNRMTEPVTVAFVTDDYWFKIKELELGE